VASPLVSQIRKQLAAGFKGKLLPGVIRKFIYTVDQYGDRQTIGYNDYPFKSGIREAFDARYRAQALIPETDVKLLILLGSTSVQPAQADKVQLQGLWYEVRQVLEIDPATASISLQCFAVPHARTG